jgi:hypothetical protein
MMMDTSDVDAETEYAHSNASTRIRAPMHCRDCGSLDHTHKNCPTQAPVRELVSNVEQLCENGLGGTISLDLPNAGLPEETLIREHWFTLLKTLPVTAELLVAIYKAAPPQFRQDFEHHVAGCMSRIQIETEREQVKMEKEAADIKQQQLELALKIEKKREADKNQNKTWFGRLGGSFKAGGLSGSFRMAR